MSGANASPIGRSKQIIMKHALITLCLLFASATGLHAQARPVEVTVLDSQGLPISGAKITQTERQGTPGVYDVRVEADGFEGQTVTVDVRNQATPVEIRLQPQRLSQEIIVAATRTEQRLGDIPASASVLHSDEIKASPAVVADDILRQVPTFSLFRRTSSLAAHPTAQGVSLRGIGPSGVSRTLVLLDNTPFNDPFGGWVYWTRVPLMSVDRIELVDGANSSVYGNYAMGGVINVITTQPQNRTLILKPQYGGRRNNGVWDGLGSLDFFASDVWNKFGVAIEGSALNTNGYPIIPERDLDGITPLRGRIDQKATVNYQNLNLKLDYKHSDRVTAFFRGGYFSEDRSNAKFCAPTSCEETNDTLWKFVSGSIRARLADQSDLQATVSGNFETFHSSFLAVPASNPPRSLARLTILQKVPTKDASYMVQWSKAIAGRHYFSVGTDWRWVDGDSVEDAMDGVTGTRVVTKRLVGGTQRSQGVFLQDIVSVTRRLQLTLSARLDHWKNYNAHSLENDAVTGLPTVNNRLSLPDKANTVGSPHIGALYHLTDAVSVWGGASWGFRAPTLNELYRAFAVGAVRTLANENLGPERLVGGEAGVNVAPVRGLTWRTTWFSNRVKNPVSNVTLTTPANTRQRQNLGKTGIWGIQSDIEYRLKTYWRLTGGYLYDMATVKEFPADPTLVRRLLPQVPKHRGSAQMTYSHPRYFTASLGAQFSSRQFEDDQNVLRLPGYGVVDVNFSRTLSRNVDMFFGVQNLLDRTFYVQRNPTTIGAPRLITVGFRVTFAGR
jgi:outer membrane receptor protein involved in Fe transport